MSHHSFDIAIAEIVGVNAAVIYQNIVWWCEKNAANGRHIREGKAWTYNSKRAFSVLFPYLSEKQIRTALDKLKEADLIEVGNFNETPYDRTSWYCPKAEIDLPKKANGNAEKGETYRSVLKPDSKPDSAARSVEDFFEEFWDAYPKVHDRADTLSAFEKVLSEGEITPEALVRTATLYRLQMKAEARHVKHMKSSFNFLALGAYKDYAARAADDVTAGTAKPKGIDDRLEEMKGWFESDTPKSTWRIRTFVTGEHVTELLKRKMITIEQAERFGA